MPTPPTKGIFTVSPTIKNTRKTKENQVKKHYEYISQCFIFAHNHPWGLILSIMTIDTIWPTRTIIITSRPNILLKKLFIASLTNKLCFRFIVHPIHISSFVLLTSFGMGNHHFFLDTHYYLPLKKIDMAYVLLLSKITRLSTCGVCGKKLYNRLKPIS